jgi:hypothetical protein
LSHKVDLAFEEIPVDVPIATLQKVKDFYEHHEYRDIKSVRKPIKSSNFTTLASEWDNTFFKTLSEEDMSDLLLVTYSMPFFLYNKGIKLFTV